MALNPNFFKSATTTAPAQKVSSKSAKGPSSGRFSSLAAAATFGLDARDRLIQSTTRNLMNSLYRTFNMTPDYMPPRPSMSDGLSF